VRSEMIFGAIARVPNRFLLARLLAKATRGFHAPGARIQDTTNDVLARFGRCNPIGEVHATRDSTIVENRSRPHPVPAYSTAGQGLEL
jgi:hypothetical protein